MKDFESRYNAWLDGQLNPVETAAFERELAAQATDPAAELRSHELVRDGLRDLIENTPLPHADFFQHRLMERIHADVAAHEGHRAPVAAAVPWFGSLYLRLAVTGAAALLLGTLAFHAWIAPQMEERPETVYLTQVLDAKVGDGRVSVEPKYYQDGQAAVLVLDGMEQLPEGYAQSDEPQDADTAY